MSGEMTASSAMPSTIARPTRPFGFFSSSTSHAGALMPRRDAAGAERGENGCCGSSTWTWLMSRGAHARVEDEVQEIGEEHRDDRADGEDEQERLRERVVVSERCLLQRVSGAGIAEDELHEDHAADGGREL